MQKPDKLSRNPDDNSLNDSNAVILPTLESLQDHASCEHFVIPPKQENMQKSDKLSRNPDDNSLNDSDAVILPTLESLQDHASCEHFVTTPKQENMQKSGELSRNPDDNSLNDSDTVILPTLESLQDHTSCEHFVIPPKQENMQKSDKLSRNPDDNSLNDSDAVILPTLESLQDRASCEHFVIPPKQENMKKSDKLSRNPNDNTLNDSDAVILPTLESLQDHVSCEHFVIPPKQALKPCTLSTTCYRMPIYIGGRYLKFSRKVSQSRWIVDDERMGEASVEEIIGNNALLVCKGDTYKFHAAGREDIDVRMLGSGRPFLVEILNARCMSSAVDIDLISQKINSPDQEFVRVKNLKVMGSEAWSLMREGEAEKQKQYAALVWISRPLTDEDRQSLTSKKDMDILQRTPIRVLHRRSPLVRKRVIHWMKVEGISNSCQYFILHLCTQAGTYIKEFVHGDLGRTNPSIGSILGCRAEILQLDVTDVKMDVFMDDIMPSCS